MKINLYKLKKVNKRQACKLFMAGKDIYLYPAKINIFSCWSNPVIVNKKDNNDNFTDIINNFEYYNCCYSLGYYAKYYIMEE